MLLSELPLNSSAVITKLYTNNALRLRLQELGFFEGAKVKCLLKSPLGEPTAYKICDSIIALRKPEADSIEILGGEDIGTHI